MPASIFQVERTLDEDTIRLMKKLIDEIGGSLSNSAYTLRGGEASRAFNPATPTNDAPLKEVIALNASAVQRLSFSLGNVSFTLTRPDDKLLDTISISNNTGGTNIDVDLQVVRVVVAARNIFKAYDVNKQLAQMYPEPIRALEEVREANLSRLEQLNETLIRRTEEYRLELDRKAEATRERLENEAEKRREEQEAKHVAELQKLEDREIALDERIADIDSRESKHARRGIRKELQAELQKRANKFELTQGTRRMRWPIAVTCAALAVYLGLLTGFYAIKSLELLTSNDHITIPQIIALSVKQIVITAGFIGICTYFIRWENQWFDQHAREEFRLKRYSLDVEWANWVVETALEWKKENNSEIPTELLNRLSSNLFAEEKEHEDQPNPADQLASAIFGSAASATIEAAGGKVNLTRNGIKTLAKSGNES